MTDKIAEIRARHEEGVRAGADEDRAYLLAEVEQLRAENERLYNEDTKTRHALEGWVFVCPDGGADPTHERVAAVVAEFEKQRAEIERLTRERDEARYFLRIFVHAHAHNNAVPPHIDGQARKALEAKP